MNSPTHLFFDSRLGRQKPENIANRSVACPFCERDSLRGILARDGPFLLVKNKYPVLQDAFMTVLIETDTCEGDLSTYPKDHLHRLFRFGVSQWLAMEENGQYASVLFFKNHGPLSGGSIYHPHMQIIGLKNIDYKDRVQNEHFDGLTLEEGVGVCLRLSTKPKVGFFEFNVIVEDLNRLDEMSDYIQIVVHYMLNHFHRKLTSYNLFFYRIGEKIAVKIMPRFPTSPIYVGYSIPQVSNLLEDVAEEVKRIYRLGGRHGLPGERTGA